MKKLFVRFDKNSHRLTICTLLLPALLLFSLCTLSGCCCTAAQSAEAIKNAQVPPIVGGWELITDQSDAPKITLNVTNKGNIYGCSGVNDFQGKLISGYAAGKFAFDGGVAVTMRMGEGIEYEQDFLQKLNKVTSYQVSNDGILELKDARQTLLRFRKRVLTELEYSRIFSDTK